MAQGPAARRPAWIPRPRSRSPGRSEGCPLAAVRRSRHRSRPMNPADPGVMPDLPALRAAYSHFLRPDRILLTGHSHQAWPDVSRDALIRLFDDAARLVDDKWSAAVFPKCEAVGRGILERMGFDPGDPIALGKSTQELVFR